MYNFMEICSLILSFDCFWFKTNLRLNLDNKLSYRFKVLFSCLLLQELTNAKFFAEKSLLVDWAGIQLKKTCMTTSKHMAPSKTLISKLIELLENLVGLDSWFSTIYAQLNKWVLGIYFVIICIYRNLKSYLNKQHYSLPTL